ncbi:hypothetical protein PMAYCL1PPCAC_09724, partial [Pristionchus mayeri]
FQYNNWYTVKSICLIYPIPLMLAVRYIAWSPFLVEARGLYGPIFMSTISGEGLMWEVVKYGMIAYYIATTLIQFVLNAASLVNYANRKKVLAAFKYSNKANYTTEVGLFATTMCNCLVAVVFTVFQVLIQFFPESSITGFARSGTTIIVDVMALMHIYLLLAFSPALRKFLFP